MNDVGLCIIFNHPFPAQIPMLRSIYANNFSRILFLLPFDRELEGDDIEIVYAGGFTFDMMLTQASRRIISYFKGCSVVLFLHNDCLLNPSISGSNLCAEFDVQQGTIVTPGMGSLMESLSQWAWGFRAAINWNDPSGLFAGGGKDVKSYLPTEAEAVARATALGLNPSTFLRPADSESLAKLPAAYQVVHRFLFGGEGVAVEPLDIHYPIQIGYCDFFIIAADILPDWLYYVSLLSSMSLFAEASISTAHMLAAKRIRSFADLGRPCEILWGGQDRSAASSMEWIRRRFSEGCVFIHPVKYNLMPPSFVEELSMMYQRPATHESLTKYIVNKNDAPWTLDELQAEPKARVETMWSSPPSTMLGSGYAMPNRNGLHWTAIGEANDDNWLLSPSDADRPQIPITMWGKHNVVVVGHHTLVTGTIALICDSSTIVIGDHAGHGSAGVFHIVGRGRGSLLFIGSRTSSNHTSFYLLGDNVQIIVGEDCMFAAGIAVRSGDDHAVLDMTSGHLLNPPANIHIEPHVWVCQEVTILKNVRVGSGSILGVKSLVNKNIPPFSLAGGVPARVLKREVSWDRSAVPGPDAHRKLATHLAR